MYQVENLQSLTLQELNEFKADTEAKKAKLEALKAKNDKNWTEENQEELQQVVMLLVDVEEVIDEKSKAAAEVKTGYTPAAGTEKMVHLLVAQGRRFNPNTGEEESKPTVRLFTFSEYQLFKKHYASLGYTIVEELHNPYKK